MFIVETPIFLNNALFRTHFEEFLVFENFIWETEQAEDGLPTAEEAYNFFTFNFDPEPQEKSLKQKQSRRREAEEEEEAESENEEEDEKNEEEGETERDYEGEQPETRVNAVPTFLGSV